MGKGYAALNAIWSVLVSCRNASAIVAELMLRYDG